MKKNNIDSNPCVKYPKTSTITGITFLVQALGSALILRYLAPQPIYPQSELCLDLYSWFVFEISISLFLFPLINHAIIVLSLSFLAFISSSRFTCFCALSWHQLGLLAGNTLDKENKGQRPYIKVVNITFSFASSTSKAFLLNWSTQSVLGHM